MFIPPVYKVYRAYIVFGFSVRMLVCLSVCKLFFPSWISEELLHHAYIYPSLVLVQPRKTRPCLTERLLMGGKESNQTNKQTSCLSVFLFILFTFSIIHSNVMHMERGTCIKGLFWPPLELKAESCFSPISSYWFIRIIAQV